MEKYHKTDICPIENENERDENYVGSNTCIDSSRTKDNYRLLFRNSSYTDFINARISELNLPKAPRKDAVLMASFVVGSDREFFKGLDEYEQNSFFRDCANFFIDRYGRRNIISAVVHNDETTPHLHLNLIPIKDGRLCAKDLLNRNELSKLQTDFYEQVGKRWGLQRGKEGSTASHLSTAEFKAKCIVDEAWDKSTEILSTAGKRVQAELETMEKAVQKADEHFTETMKEISTAKAERDKIVEQRNAEADYSQALEDAKQGKFAFSKSGLRNQIVVLTAEVQRLEEVIDRQQKDNDLLYKEHQELSKEKEKFTKMSRAYTLFREREPEAFTRAFHRAPSIVGAFIPKDEPIANLGKSRLRQIEEEIERENATKTEYKKKFNNNSKAD
ncbi:MAG: plasmid recombination protein [Clostridia bacterium]|nr:plasmid recombination protein [Clostridia bacterium]